MDEPLPRANKKSGQVSYHDQAQLHELQVFAGEETRRTHYSTILEVENSCEGCIKYGKSNRMCLRSIREGVVHMSNSDWGMSRGGGMHGFGYMSNAEVRTKTTFVH
ncbi:hypothetical protein YC2023_019213 [Brassica napus]